VLIEAMHAGAVTVTPDGVVQYANTWFAEMVRLPLEQVIGGPFPRFVPDAEWPTFQALMDAAKDRGVTGEIHLRRAWSDNLPVHLSLRFLREPDQQVFCLVVTDLSERKRAEEALRQANDALEARVAARTNELAEANRALQDGNLGLEELNAELEEEALQRQQTEAALQASEDKFRRVFESSPDYIVLFSLHTGRVLDANAAFEQIAGYGRDEILNRSILELGVLPDPDQRARLLQDLAESGAVRDREITLQSRWGERRVGLLACVTVAISGEPVVVSVVRDITERKGIENRLREAVADKEVLLGEVHHRTKNNLQMLCSLIEMQADAIQSPEGKDALDATGARIYAIARLHEHLYRSMSSGEVLLTEYLQGLADSFREGCGTQIDLRVLEPGATVTLNVDRAITCGLIVNELVTNAVKHAFPDGRTGEIRIAAQAAGGQIALRVWDNGQGLPPALRIEHASSLGLRLVNILARRLGAEIKIESYEGAAFTLTFPSSPEE
jgi:PAS domain S-box-containing protein